MCIANSDLLLVVKNLWSPLTLGHGFKKGVHRIKSGTGEGKEKKTDFVKAKSMPVREVHTSQQFKVHF